MANFRLKRFANAAILKKINPQLLLDFLRPFRQFLTSQCDLYWPVDPRDFDHQALANILISPRADMPEALLDALYFVDTLSGDDYFDRLLEDAHTAGIDCGSGDLSCEDMALRIWLHDPSILERIHAQQHCVRAKTFRSYLSSDIHHIDWLTPDSIAHKKLEAELNEWFDFKKKGRGARVFFFPGEDNVWMLVRHGQRIRREGTVESGGESGSVYYRPEKFDSLIYYPKTGELAIHAGTQGERGIYCKLIGRHIFADDEFFRFDNPVTKYTLQPLAELYWDSLACGDVEGLSHVRLYELQLSHILDQNDIEIRRADDVFRALVNQQRFLHTEIEYTILLRAKFKMRFEDGRERTISIEPPNIASFDHELDDTIIHNWLARRGFILTENIGEESIAVLEVA